MAKGGFALLVFLLVWTLFNGAEASVMGFVKAGSGFVLGLAVIDVVNYLIKDDGGRTYGGY